MSDDGLKIAETCCLLHLYFTVVYGSVLNIHIICNTPRIYHLNND